MRCFLRAVAFALLCALALASTADAAGSGGVRALRANRTFVPEELILRFKPSADRYDRANVVREMGASRKRFLRVPRAELLDLPDGLSVEAAVRRFEARPEVEYAEPNWIYRAAATVPNDPRFGELWGLNQASDHDVDAPEAWDITTGSSAVKVAVVDTGVAYDHPDLAGNMLPGYDFVSNDTDPRDENGHGTHVAGTIGARGNNSAGVAGVNWDVSSASPRRIETTSSRASPTQARRPSISRHQEQRSSARGRPLAVSSPSPSKPTFRGAGSPEDRRALGRERAFSTRAATSAEPILLRATTRRTATTGLRPRTP